MSPPPGASLGPGLGAAPGGVEAGRVHPAAPQPHVADPAAEQAGRGDRGRGQRPGGVVVDAAATATRPPHRARRAGRRARRTAGRSGTRRPPAGPAAGEDRAVRAEHDRAGQVNDLGPVPEQRVPHLLARQAEPEARVAGQRHGRDADDRVGERPGIPALARRLLGPRRRRRDDKWLAAAGGEEFRHPHHAVGDAVDVGREGFGDDRDPHGQKVRHQPIEVPLPP